MYVYVYVVKTQNPFPVLGDCEGFTDCPTEKCLPHEVCRTKKRHPNCVNNGCKSDLYFVFENVVLDTERERFTSTEVTQAVNLTYPQGLAGEEAHVDCPQYGITISPSTGTPTMPSQCVFNYMYYKNASNFFEKKKLRKIKGMFHSPVLCDLVSIVHGQPCVD